MKRIIFITILLLWAGIAWAGPPSSPPGGNNIPITAVYSGTTSLEESTASDDSGAYIVGAYDNFTNSSSTNVQGVLEDFDTAIGTKAPTDSPALTTQATVDNAFNFRTALTTAGHEWSIQVYDNTTSAWKDAFQFVNGTTGNYKIVLGVPLTGISSMDLTSGTLAAPSGTNPTTDSQGEMSLDESDAGQDPLFLEAYDEGVGDASRIVGSDIHCESFTILEPDQAQAASDDIKLKHFVAEAYPHGATIIALHVSTDGTDISDTFLFEIWDDEDGTSQTTCESIALSSADHGEDDGIDSGSVTADYYLNLNLDDSSDDYKHAIITVVYRINPGD